jgi:hypothetical protein
MFPQDFVPCFGPDGGGLVGNPLRGVDQAGVQANGRSDIHPEEKDFKMVKPIKSSKTVFSHFFILITVKY